MAQFNQFPNYSPYQSNPYIQAPAQASNGINWVQGIEGAKAWQLQQNINTLLLDSENDGVFYIKTSDNVGMCNLRIFKFEEVTSQQKQSNVDMSEYVKKSELESIITSMLGGKKNEQPIQATQSDKRKITV